MVQEAITTLGDILEEPDETFATTLPEVLAGFDDQSDVDELLLEDADAYQDLITRMATLEKDMGAYYANNSETVDTFLTILWGGLGRLTEIVPAAQDAVDTAMTVSWVATDCELTFHVVADPDTGEIDGGPGRADDPDVTFEGEADVLLRMIGDDEFNAQRGFLQRQYTIEGSIPLAREFGTMMEDVVDSLETFGEEFDEDEAF